MEIVFDIEANGLHLPQYDRRKDEWMAVADRAWCVCWSTASGDERGSYDTVDDELFTYNMALNQADTLIGHNIIGYDLPFLKRLYGWVPKEGTRIVDTLVLSRLLNPDRGSHSLDAWGERLGYPKGEYSDWTQYTPEMLSYCERDVELNRQVYLALVEEMGDWDWSESIELEHRYAEIMQRQEEHGVYFDMGAAHALESRLEGEILEIDNAYDLPSNYKQVGVSILKPFKINGEPTARVKSWFAEDPILYGSVQGPFTKIERVPLNLGSEKQVKDYLLANGWKPTQWNFVDGKRTSPKITEDSFGTIDGDFGQKIKRRKICSHRLSQLQGWIKNVRPDGRISASANTIGTPTGRCRHKTVVNVPAARAPFGEEMRSLFTVPDGYVMVGHDADQLELRMLAHYMGDDSYIQEILSGDVHSHNQKLAGLDTRDAAKSFIYAFIYGAGNEKLGQLAGGGARKGSQLRAKFLRELPALKRLIDTVQQAALRGYLIGLDGRKVWMRREEHIGWDGVERGKVLTHKALNTLLQSAGAVLMKKSVVLLDDMIREQQHEAFKVIDMHDEGQHEVVEHEAEAFGLLAEQSVVDAGEAFNLRIPMKASASIGKNWFETH